MIGSNRILGADNYATNISGNNYVPSVQATTGKRSKLHKLTVSNLTGSTVYAWIYDLAAGSSSSAGPRVVLQCPATAGFVTTLDYSTGKAFYNGIYVILSSTAPTDATTTPTAAANNAAILDIDYRYE